MTSHRRLGIAAVLLGLLLAASLLVWRGGGGVSDECRDALDRVGPAVGGRSVPAGVGDVQRACD